MLKRGCLGVILKNESWAAFSLSIFSPLFSARYFDCSAGEHKTSFLYVCIVKWDFQMKNM